MEQQLGTVMQPDELTIVDGKRYEVGTQKTVFRGQYKGQVDVAILKLKGSCASCVVMAANEAKTYWETHILIWYVTMVELA